MPVNRCNKIMFYMQRQHSSDGSECGLEMDDLNKTTEEKPKKKKKHKKDKDDKDTEVRKHTQ